MSIAIKSLRTLTSSFLKEIHTALNSVIAGLEVKSEIHFEILYSCKKCEEMVANNLSLLRRLYRGCAELVNDDFTPDEIIRCNLSTGRQAMLEGLDADEIVYIKQYRKMLFQELISIHQKLDSTHLVTGFTGLRNNVFIAKQWMKVLILVVARRTSFLKDTDGVKKWLQYSSATADTAVSHGIYKLMKLHNINDCNAVTNPTSLLARFMDKLFWKNHDQV